MGTDAAEVPWSFFSVPDLETSGQHAAVPDSETSGQHAVVTDGPEPQDERPDRTGQHAAVRDWDEPPPPVRGQAEAPVSPARKRFAGAAAPGRGRVPGYVDAPPPPPHGRRTGPPPVRAAADRRAGDVPPPRRDPGAPERARRPARGPATGPVPVQPDGGGVGNLPTAPYAGVPAPRQARRAPRAPHPVPAAAAWPAARVDYEAVRLLRSQIGEALTRWLRTGEEPTEDDIARERDQLAAEVVARHSDMLRRGGTPVTSDDEAVLLATVQADMVGLGRLQRMLTDPTIEEVHILGCDRVRITRRDGTVELGEPIADSDDEMVEVLQVLARRAGATERSLSTAQPILDLQLPGGERLAATYQVSHRPYAVIRQHGALDVTLPDIAGGHPGLDEMIDPLIGDFLRASVAAGLNVMIAGRAGAGKTTLLRALASEIPAEEPFIVLEESRELGLHRDGRHRWVMSFESRDGHGEKGADGRPAGEITIADLIPVALRMSAQRIIVGEVRSREIVPMLEAMTTSRGSMCTIHARGAGSVTDRIIQLALAHGPSMTPDLAQRTAANGIDLIVYVNLHDETAIGGRKHRYVSTIEEVTGTAPGGRIAHTTVFGPGPDGRGIPRHLPERVRDDLLRVGYDAAGHLGPWIEAGAGAWHRHTHALLARPA